MIRSIALALLLAAGATSAQAQNLIIHGGPIYTGVDGAPPAQQVTVVDGRITYVGPMQLERIPPDEYIDLKGAALFPGFTDGHAHLDGIGWRELTLNLEGSASVAEAMARLAAWAEANPTAPSSAGAGSRPTGLRRAS